MRRLAAATLAALAALALAGCGDATDGPGPAGAPAVAEDPGADHVHGLGINPRDGALFVATHTGLFRSAPGETTSERVGDLLQDTMGFTVTGPDEFLGSGHPDGRTDLPPLLGLIRSTDAGETWTPVSLLGKADFHVLRSAGKRIYGADATSGRLLVSDDGGTTWQERRPPGPLLDLVVDPRDPDHVVGATEDGLHESADAGRTWRAATRERTGYLAWPRPGALAIARPDGRIASAASARGPWRDEGSLQGPPGAFLGTPDALYAALHDGTIQVSEDGGRTWTTRATP